MENLAWYHILILFVGSGILGATIKFIWDFSKRNTKIDEIEEKVKNNYMKISTLKEKHLLSDEEYDERITNIEKELIAIKANQKNLIHSIEIQNKQIIALIDRLEKNHDEFIKSQKQINEKLEASIDAIKNTLIESSHNSCIFFKKDISEVKDLISTLK